MVSLASSDVPTHPIYSLVFFFFFSVTLVERDYRAHVKNLKETTAEWNVHWKAYCDVRELDLIDCEHYLVSVLVPGFRSDLNRITNISFALSWHKIWKKIG